MDVVYWNRASVTSKRSCRACTPGAVVSAVLTLGPLLRVLEVTSFQGKDGSARRQGRRHNDRPPSTGIVAPVTASVAASASHAIVAATSRGRISRAIGCWEEKASADSRP